MSIRTVNKCYWCGQDFDISGLARLFTWFAPKFCCEHCCRAEKESDEAAKRIAAAFRRATWGEGIGNLRTYDKTIFQWPDWSPNGKKRKESDKD